MKLTKNISFIHADCMDILRELPDNAYYLAIVDPPYFSGPERRGFYGSDVSAARVSRHKYEITAKWEVPGKEYFDQLVRVAGHYIVWGCNYYDYHFAPGRIVWDKCNGASSFSDCEIAATDLISSVRLFPYMWNGMCQGKSMTEGRIMQGNKKLNEVRIHPTQKPVALYAWLLSRFARDGWKILDTYLGSGSIALACDKLNFQLLGIELEQHYYESAIARFQEYKAIPSLFN